MTETSSESPRPRPGRGSGPFSKFGMRSAIYARVSTTHQETENQVRALRSWAEARRLQVVDVYRENRPGWEPDREQLSRLFRDAHLGRFDFVLIWSIDRFSRQGIQATLDMVTGLLRSGVIVDSHEEPFLKDSEAENWELSVAWASHVAKQFRTRLRVNTKAGMERARSNGIHVGRAATYRFDHARAAVLRAGGLGWRSIADELHVPRTAVTSIRRAVGAYQRGSPKSPRPARL